MCMKCSHWLQNNSLLKNSALQNLLQKALLYFRVSHPGVLITSIIITSYCQSDTPMFIVLTYYMGNIFWLIKESSSGPYIQIQIFGHCDCVMGSVFVYRGVMVTL
jgi:hypothetical protein